MGIVRHFRLRAVATARVCKCHLLAVAFLVIGGAILPAQVVTGKVTSAAGAPLGSVAIAVEGTPLGAVTRDDGTYRIAGVPAGSRVIVARRVGYTLQRRTVTVASTDVTADFQLEPSVTALEGVVTTATGQQRKIELGNAVSSIDVATLKEAQPIKSMSDLLTAHATGVVVMPASVAGTTARIRIRGQNSLSVSNDPIYIVDGVRMTGDASTANIGFVQAATSSRTSRINDINPEEIENIEIVKGPSAATLYGTDAANGVIVITTKRGKAGPGRWGFHAEQGVNMDNTDYAKTYGLIGYLTNNLLQTPTRCRAFQVYHYDTLTKALAPQCIITLASSVDLARIDSTTWIRPGPRSAIGGNVSGGSDALRYFISGDRVADIGPMGLPPIDRHRFDSLGVAVRPEMERPSQLHQYSFRSNINATIGPKFDMAVSVGGNFNKQQFPLSGNNAGIIQNLTFAPGWVRGLGANPALGGWGTSPGNAFRSNVEQTTNRFIGTITGTSRPFAWLNGTADVGVDVADERTFSLDRAGENSNLGGAGGLGAATDERARFVSFTTNVRGTANWQLNGWAQLRSSGGWQFVATDRSIVQSRGTDLGPGGEVPGQGVNKFVTSSNRPIRTMGMYVEEQLALRDRLYLTGAVRTDQASAFGTAFQNTFYPKAALSWIASDEPFFPSVPLMGQFRVRASFGTSGVQPGLTEALTTYAAGSGSYSGATGNALVLTSTGNPNLKPERSSEIEMGFDSRWWEDRVNVEFTYYNKRTKDALFTQPTATSAGVPGFRTNIGGMQNRGIEYRINAQLADTRSVGFDVNFSGSNNRNKILDLGPVVLTNRFAANQPGLPAGAIFKRKMTWDDRNGDGHLGVQEVRLHPLDSTFYMGPGLDPVQMTLMTGLELIGRRLRMQAMFDRKDGAFSYNTNAATGCNPGPFPGCRGTNDLNAPIFEQARGIALFFYQNSDAYIESTAYTRLRELSVSYDLGGRIARRVLGATSARLALSARNVFLWADEWTTGDPEQNVGNGSGTNQWSFGLPSYYMVRLNLTY